MICWRDESNKLIPGFNISTTNNHNGDQAIAIIFKLYRLCIRVRFRSFDFNIYKITWLPRGTK